MSSEQKFVTTLFASFGDLRPPSAEQENEAIFNQALARTHRLEAALANHGGQTVRHRGNVVVAVFGTRRLREENAIEAVKAGLEVAAAFEEAESHVRPQSRIRIGIHTRVAEAA